MVGLNGGDQVGDAPEIHAEGLSYERIDTATSAEISAAQASGVKVFDDMSGPYETSGGPTGTGGVSAINATTWADNAADWYASDCGSNNSTCVAIEVLNEPDGNWFWGSDASEQVNATAYANLLKTVHNTFVSRFGADRPLILAAWDNTPWGPEVWSADPNVDSYIDGVVVHPYGGDSGQDGGAQGNRAQIAQAHADTGMPVFITEVGWPTAVGQPSTGDSQQWTDTQQADNIYNFVTWAKGVSYIKAVMIFGIRDYGTNDWYGVHTSNSAPSNPAPSRKPSYYALGEAANGQACTVC
jgi:hypothetical protein